MCRLILINLYLTFVRPKSDGGIRVILNLKPFNQQFVYKIHFEMESLKSVINAIRQTVFGQCGFEGSILLYQNKGNRKEIFTLLLVG